MEKIMAMRIQLIVLLVFLFCSNGLRADDGDTFIITKYLTPPEDRPHDPFPPSGGVEYRIVSEDEQTVESIRYFDYANYVLSQEEVEHNGKIYRVIGAGYSSAGFCANGTLELPNSMYYIGWGAFSRFMNEIVIPNSIKFIDHYAFCESYSWRKLTSLIQEPFEIPEDCFIETGIEAEKFTLYVPRGTKHLYEQTPGWNVVKNIEEIDVEPNSIKQPEINRAIKYEAGQLTLTGLNEGEIISILSPSGTHIKDAYVKNGQVQISVSHHPFLIIKTGTNVFKIVTK